MRKRVVAKPRPCFTQFVTGHISEVLLSIVLNNSHHAFMKLFYNVYECSWAYDLIHDFPESISAYCAKSFCKVDIV